MKHFAFVVVSIVFYIFCVGLVVVVALQTSRSEGLSGILAGGGGGGGKVGRERGLERWSQWLGYGWLVLAFLVATLR
jgi:protein translocase SecG subunit